MSNMLWTFLNYVLILSDTASSRPFAITNYLFWLMSCLLLAAQVSSGRYIYHSVFVPNGEQVQNMLHVKSRLKPFKQPHSRTKHESCPLFKFPIKPELLQC